MKQLLKKAMIFLCAMQSTLLFAAQPEKNSLVLQVTLDKESTVALAKKEQEYANSALTAFIGDLTMVPEISVRTAKVDDILRDIQRKSQKEASTGLGSEDTAYASDKGSKAKLLLSLSMKALSSGKYTLTCAISEIETMTVVSTLKSANLALEDTNGSGIDSLAFDTLKSLQKKGYISEVSYDVENQLLHRKNNAENFQKYIDDYTEQLEAANKELSELHSDNETAEQKLEADSKEQALKLRIEMMEKKKQQAEENLRQQQAEDDAEAKRETEMAEWDTQQKNEFLKKIKELEAKKEEIRKETRKGISLKNRIELIETDKTNVAYIESQLNQSIKESDAFYDSKCNAEVTAKKNEPWKKADLGKDKQPTEIAQSFRNDEVAQIQAKYAEKKTAAEKELRGSMQSDLTAYRTQIADNITELGNTLYVFRSIDKTDDFLTLSVDEYDADSGSWEVHSSFNMNGIPKVDVSSISLPDLALSYETMTGKKPVTNMKGPNAKQAYEEYRTLVDQADSYFRTSVPYLYSEIALKVAYDEASDTYKTQFQYLSIYKTEDRSELNRVSADDLDKAKKTETKLAEAREKEEARQKQEQEAEEARKLRQQTKEEQQAKSKRLFAKSQVGRDGLFTDLSVMNSKYYNGFDIDAQICFGGRYFFGGAELSFIPFSLAGFDTYKEEEGSIVDTSFFVGVTVNLGKFRPYAECGVGVSKLTFGDSTLSSTDEDDGITGLCTQVVGGFDIKGKAYCIGGFYKFKYFYGFGFADCYGISLGLMM
jgi:hypothetical protein